MIERWAERLPALHGLDLCVETGRHVAHRHPNTLTIDSQENGIPYIDRRHIQPNKLAWPHELSRVKNRYDPTEDAKPLEITEPGGT